MAVLFYFKTLYANIVNFFTSGIFNAFLNTLYAFHLFACNYVVILRSSIRSIFQFLNWLFSVKKNQLMELVTILFYDRLYYMIRHHVYKEIVHLRNEWKWRLEDIQKILLKSQKTHARNRFRFKFYFWWYSAQQYGREDKISINKPKILLLN